MEYNKYIHFLKLKNVQFSVKKKIILNLLSSNLEETVTAYAHEKAP